MAGTPREAPIQERANASYENKFGENGWITELLAIHEDYEGEKEHEYEGEPLDSDGALERLQEDLLAVTKLTTNHVQEEIEWEILLSTGGPAARVLVTTDFRGVVEEADYQFQDWFEPWTSAENQDTDRVRRYAELVGYYESSE